MFNYPIPNDMPDYIDGDITFIGVLHKHWPELSKGGKNIGKSWNEDTQKTYYKTLLNDIAPHLKDRPLIDYKDPAYFYEVIEIIRKSGTRRNTKITYSDSTMDHYLYLMHRVYIIASKYEDIPNIFLLEETDDNDYEPKDPAIRKQRKRIRMKKSFSAYQEWLLYDYLLRDPSMSGFYVIALLMWVFGARNKEACALRWCHIIEVPEHPGYYMLAIYRSTEKDTSEDHLGGKTPNMFRFVPIPPLVYEFLMRRKAIIQSKIDAGIIKLSKAIPSIEQMPIGCQSERWLTKCTSKQVTAKCKELFKAIGLTNDQLDYFSKPPEKGDSIGTLAYDKDPTAYTFRRNFATHCTILQQNLLNSYESYSLEDIQYMLGHRIDPHSMYRRSDYTNPDMMFRLHSIMKLRPIMNPISSETSIIEISGNYRANNVHDAKFRIHGKTGALQITVIPNSSYHTCKLDMIKINTGDDTQPIPCLYQQTATPYVSPVPISMLYHYHKSYETAFNLFMSKKKQSNATKEVSNK